MCCLRELCLDEAPVTLGFEFICQGSGLFCVLSLSAKSYVSSASTELCEVIFLLAIWMAA